MKFFEAIMRNWFIGMKLFVLNALVLSVNTTNAAVTSPYVQEKVPTFLFHNEISQIAFNVIENNLENCCQNERNLIAYRNWAVSHVAIAAKGGTTVFRAVDETKAAIIKNTGEFSLQEGGVEAKYFAKYFEGAHWYGKGFILMATQLFREL